MVIVTKTQLEDTILRLYKTIDRYYQDGHLRTTIKCYVFFALYHCRFVDLWESLKFLRKDAPLEDELAKLARIWKKEAKALNERIMCYDSALLLGITDYPESIARLQFEYKLLTDVMYDRIAKPHVGITKENVERHLRHFVNEELNNKTNFKLTKFIFSVPPEYRTKEVMELAPCLRSRLYQYSEKIQELSELISADKAITIPKLLSNIVIPVPRK